MLFDKVIAFDNIEQKIILMVNIALDNPYDNYNKAIEELRSLANLLKNSTNKAKLEGKLLGEAKALFNQDQFSHMVTCALHHIHEGDIFQIVLSNLLTALFEGSLFNTYCVLRTLNPSPYMFYLSGSKLEVAASPETLVKLENGVLHTFPFSRYS